jgi:hypothetical protein
MRKCCRNGVAVAVAVVAFAMAAGPAVASFSLGGYSGPVKFTFEGYDAGTVGYGPGPGTICATAAACDAVPGIVPAPGFYPLGPPVSANEDTWGVYNVLSINRLDNNAVLWSTSPAERLTSMYYGLADDVVEAAAIGGGTLWSTKGIGGHQDIYIRSGDPVDVTLGSGGRTALDKYTTATAGTLFLSMVFSPNAILGDTTHTFRSTFSNVSTTGGADGYVDVTGGAYAWMFNTNSQPDLDGNLHDMKFNITTDFTHSTPDWTVSIAGQASGAVPEPAPLSLMLVGLLGIAARRVRRVAPQAKV